MKINDRIYGEFEIDDPLIIELINTSAFQRLKNINQYGAVNFVFDDKYQCSRFEHSIGVWYVLKKLGVDLETQVAGLLHDIGHTAFSHMIDHVFESKEEDYHEKILHKLDGIEEINVILKENDIVLKDLDEYKEIKQSLPGIGADRFDYAIRNYVDATGTEKDFANEALKSIKILNRELVFINTDIAEKFARIGIEAMYLVIYAPEVAVVYGAIQDILRQGLNQGWLTEDMLLKDDDSVFGIIKENKSKIKGNSFKLFEEKYIVEKGDENNHDIFHKKLKIRYFDPKILVEDQLMQVTELSEDFKSFLNSKIEIFKKREKGEYFKIKFYN